MARPRTPTATLAARGGLDRPCRAAQREGEPEVVGELGEPPGYFDELQILCWWELAGSVHDGTAGEADRFALEMTAILLAKMRRAPYAFDAASMTRLQGLLGAFGMTPADRSKLGVGGKDKPANSFDGLVKRPRLTPVK